MSNRRDRDSDSWESAIDKQIREAEERGAFDNLPGKGRPLDLRPNPHAGDREMAFKLLKDAGYAPEWIEQDKEIRTRLERARRVLANRWAWHRERTHDLAGQSGAWAEAERNHAEVAWQSAVAAFEEEVAALNRDIANLNLKVPASQFQRLLIDARREVERVQTPAADERGDR
ncbi:MAG TPA: DUF1992 domain-containing protein [Anaerolineae bacterium]|nr:DUF1992 domain-containing protein [Anaerolineae bacterium]